MKYFLFVMLLAPALPALQAQTPTDTSGEAEAQQLRQQIRERWNARVRQDLNLSDDQAAKLQGTEQKFTQQRVDLGAGQGSWARGAGWGVHPGPSHRGAGPSRHHGRSALADRPFSLLGQASDRSAERFHSLRAASRAFATARAAGLADSSSNTRQCESDQAIKNAKSHPGQRMVTWRSCNGARAAHRGQTPYLAPQLAGGATAPRSRDTTDHMRGRIGSTCRRGRGTESGRPLTSRTASTAVREMTRYQAPRRRAQFVRARTLAHCRR